jgi:hypothetical protein
LLILVGLPIQLRAQSESLSKRITINYDGADFTAVLNQISQKTQIRFAYQSNIIPNKKSFSIHITNTQAKKAIRDILHQQGLDYTLQDPNILVITKWTPVNQSKSDSISNHINIIAGRITQFGTGERLVKASVFLPQLNLFQLTDEFGVFKFPISFNGNDAKSDSENSMGDSLILIVAYPSFQTHFDTLFSHRDYFLHVQLFPQLERMETTLITAKNDISRPGVKMGMSDQFNISAAKLNKMPSLLGEADVLRSLSLNPGVVTGSEGMLGMYVRGGAADQNLVMLDEVPVFNAYHLYGMFSTFNNDIVKSAQMNRGSFNTEYGGRLSSVISVQSIDGNENEWQGNISLGLLTNKIMFQGPIWKNRTTMALAVRRSNFDYLTQPIVQAIFKDSNNINLYNFYDINAKLNHQFSEKSSLSFTYYSGGDKASFIEKHRVVNLEKDYFQKREQSNGWGNQIASLRWQYMPNEKTRFTAKAHISQYNFNQHNDFLLKVNYRSDTMKRVDDYTSYNLTNGLKDLDLSAKIDVHLNKLFAIRLGGGFTQHTFTPGDRSLYTQIDSVKRQYQYNDKKVITPEIYSHGQIEYHHPKIGYFDVGIRVTYFGLSEKQFYVRPEPRFNYRYKVNQRTWLKASASQNIQFFHQLNNLAMGLPSDLWVPSVAGLEPSQARQSAIGITRSGKKYQLSSEIFYKKFYHLLEYKENAVYATSAVNWEQMVTQGNGEAKGFEMLLEKTSGKLTGWASYTLMYNNRQFDQINQGKVFPSRYDRRHNINLVGIYQFSNKFTLSGTWTFNSGFAYTLPSGIYPSPTATDPYAEIYIYGDRNNARARANHRLDLSAQYAVNKKSFLQTWSFGVYNCYNRQNPFFITVAYNPQGNRSLYQLSLLPIIPHLNYQINF